MHCLAHTLFKIWNRLALFGASRADIADSSRVCIFFFLLDGGDLMDGTHLVRRLGTWSYVLRWLIDLMASKSFVNFSRRQA